MIKTIGVIGAGQMGSGIAHVAALAGYDVRLSDISEDALKRAVANIGRNLDRQVSKGKATQADKDAAMARIVTVGELAGLKGCDIVVEAATENEDVKRGIFKKLVPELGPETIIATNTSSISITRLAASTDRPARFIGMHFMNPVPVMKLVELVRGLATSDATMAAVVELARRMGKTTIVARDIPGFIVNRLLIPLLNEACYGLYEGLGSAADIDTGVKLGLNHPMGPLELSDLIGLDTCLAIAEVLHRELGEDKYRPCPLLRQYVAAGWLGRKVGRGFYAYDAQGQRVA